MLYDMYGIFLFLYFFIFFVISSEVKKKNVCIMYVFFFFKNIKKLFVCVCLKYVSKVY